jgi:hypothetical protein
MGLVVMVEMAELVSIRDPSVVVISIISILRQVKNWKDDSTRVPTLTRPLLVISRGASLPGTSREADSSASLGSEYNN